MPEDVTWDYKTEGNSDVCVSKHHSPCKALRWILYLREDSRVWYSKRAHWESQKERDHQEDQDVGVWTILKYILERLDGRVLTGLIWLRIGTDGGLL
jgi:hypothetical protein